MASGIYSITINGKTYIGSAINFKSRWTNHKNQLNKNIHKNKYLQNAWNKYKEMVFEIICECPISCLLGMEQHYINKYFDNQINCYNMNSIAGSSLGAHRSEETKQKMRELNKGNKHSCGHKNSLGYKHSDEFKLKMSERKKGNTFWQGKKHSEETKQKMKDTIKRSKELKYRKDI